MKITDIIVEEIPCVKYKNN